jgi:transcriptional regulator with XRE-family HTH domain
LDLTPILCRMARAGLRWRLNDLAKAAEVDRSTVNRFELGKQDPSKDPHKHETPAKLRRAFENAGIEFGEDGWVRLAPTNDGRLDVARDVTARDGAKGSD